MLAVFAGGHLEEPLSPTATKRKHLAESNLTPEEEEYVSGLWDNLYNSLPKRSRGLVTEQYLGGGANGIAFVETLSHGLAQDEAAGVTVFFKGSLRNNPSELEDAAFILEEYRRHWDHEALSDGSPVMETLAQLEGPYAFIIFDHSEGRIIVARDAEGAEPLFWGTTMASDGLLVASDRALIEGECADADAFPPGTIFVSGAFSTSGSLTPIHWEEEVLPQGTPPAATPAADAAPAAAAASPEPPLCRTESAGNLHKVASTGHMQATT